MILYIALGVLGIVTMALLLKKQKKDTLPPGPEGLPFFGVVWQIDPQAPYATMMEWAKTYGEIFTIKMFGSNFVVLNSFETVHDAMVTRSNMFAGRPPSFRFKVLNNFKDGVLYDSFSRKWQFRKSLMTQTLMTYGNSQAHLELISQEAIEERLDEMSEAAKYGRAVDMRSLLNTCITDIMSSILYGKKLDKSSVKNMLRMNEAGMKTLGQSGPGVALDLFPWMRFFPLRHFYNEICKARDCVLDTLHKEFHEAKERYVPGHESCVMDGLLEYQRKYPDAKSTKNLTDGDCSALAFEIIAAGTVTSLRTMCSLFAVLVNNPEIQMKMAEDIKRVIGDRKPCLSDRTLLPYIEAVSLEVLRYHTLNPLGLAHLTLEDLDILGHHIPKGTGIFFHLWKIHHDPEFWDDPWIFKPDRFLDDKGQLLTSDHPRCQRVLAFGAGKRACPAETLARNRLFLIVTSFIQRFEFLPESEDTRPLHDPRTYEWGVNIWPHPYKVILKPRL